MENQLNSKGTENNMENEKQFDPNRFTGKMVEVHMLYSTGVETRNRDENGSPKDAMIGGVKRARHSSQSKKFAMRCKPITIEEARNITSIVGECWRSTYMSVVICNKIEEKLARKLDDQEREKATEWLVKGLTGWSANETKPKDSAAAPAESDVVEETAVPESDEGKGKKKGAKKKANEKPEKQVDPRKTSALFVLTRNEVDSIADQCIAFLNGEVKEGKTKKGIIDVDKMLERNETTVEGLLSGLDVALYGRMFPLEKKMCEAAAVSVSHAITTHRALYGTDSFTTCGNFTVSTSGGSDFMSYNDFTSGTYYLYLSLNLDILYKYFMRMSNGDDKLSTLALQSAIDIFLNRALFCGQTGKCNTFASYEKASYAKVLVRRGQPVQVSFEKPVEASAEGGYEANSVFVLKNKIEQNKKDFGKYYGEIMSVDYGSAYDGVGLDELSAAIDQSIQKINDGVV